MVFAYYNRLSRHLKAIYRRSDAYGAIELENPASMHAIVVQLQKALLREDKNGVWRASRELCRDICKALGVAGVEVRILAARPADSGGELHGLYEREEGRRALIRIWMRTAKHKQVVAFRTFLRTLLHEVCHHLDFELLGLEETLHTEGFFQRESSLLMQLAPPATAGSKRAGSARAGGARAGSTRTNSALTGSAPAGSVRAGSARAQKAGRTAPTQPPTKRRPSRSRSGAGRQAAATQQRDQPAAARRPRRSAKQLELPF
jgi:hypothetical protein